MLQFASFAKMIIRIINRMLPRACSYKLKEHVDRYDCLYLQFDNLESAWQPITEPEAIDIATSTIDQSITNFASKKIKSVFISIPRELGSLVPKLIDRGFDFHVVNKDGLMLRKPLIKSNIPSPATHIIGGIAVVLSPTLDKLLLVRERSGKVSEFWKPPSGRIENGEFFAEGVKREVFEETGIDARFFGLIGVRETLNELWGYSGLNVICVLVAKSEQLKIDETEILEARWFLPNELLSLKYPFPWYIEMVPNFVDLMESKTEFALKQRLRAYQTEYEFRKRKTRLHLFTGVNQKL